MLLSEYEQDSMYYERGIQECRVADLVKVETDEKTQSARENHAVCQLT